jgi:predicted dienelactone hydrolase
MARLHVAFFSFALTLLSTTPLLAQDPTQRPVVDRLIERFTLLLPKDAEEKLQLSDEQKRQVAQLQKQLDDKNQKLLLKVLGEVSDLQAALEKARTEGDNERLKNIALTLTGQLAEETRTHRELEGKVRELLDAEQRKLFDPLLEQRQRPLRGRLSGRLVEREVSGETAINRASFPFADGPYTAVVADNLKLHDTARDKDVLFKVYYPRGDGPFPVIVFSHGFGGNKDAFAYLSRFWASHGYVVLHPTHSDSGALQQLREGNAAELRKRLENPKAWENRLRDVTVFLDSLAELEKVAPDLKGKLDGTRVGVAGHSFGAYTAMLLGGTTVDVPDGPASKSFADPRVKAILPISGQGTGQQGLTKTSWQKVTLPMLTMTGSLDRGVAGQTPEWREEPFRLSPEGDKYHLFLEGANHFTFGRPGPSELTDYVKAASLPFWDAYLKGKSEGKAYLRSDRLEAAGTGAVRLSRK